MADLSRQEARKGRRGLFLWAIPLGLGLGVFLMFAPSLLNELAPNRVGQDAVETSDADNEMQPVAPAGPATIQVKRSDRVGAYLSDEFGRGLYLFAKDTQGRSGTSAASECYGECADSWPPLISEGAPKAIEGVDLKLLGSTERKDGKLQVTYNGWPLYRFVRDAGPEEGTGHQLEDFGAEWYLISPQGDKIESPAPHGRI